MGNGHRNPYFGELDDRFRMERVVVEKGDDRFVGLCRMFHHNPLGVLLEDAKKNGEHVGTRTVRDYDGIQYEDPEQRTIKQVDPDTLSPSPYATHRFNHAGFHKYVADVRRRGHIGSLPTARPVDGGYEVVAGHKRTRAACEAGLDSIAVRVRDLNDREALWRFVDDHFPIKEQTLEEQLGPDHGNYRYDELEESFERMLDGWERDVLLEHPALALFVSHSISPYTEDGTKDIGMSAAEE